MSHTQTIVYVLWLDYYENKYVKLAKDFEAEEGIAKVQIHNKQIVGNIVGYADWFIMSREKERTGHWEQQILRTTAVV